MINYNYPRISFEGGLVVYLPISKHKALNVFIYRGMWLSHMFSIRPKYWALYDYADHGLNSYDLLKQLSQERNQ